MKSASKKSLLSTLATLTLPLLITATAEAKVMSFYGEIVYADNNPFGLNDTTPSTVHGKVKWDDSKLTGVSLEDIPFTDLSLYLGTETLIGDSDYDYLMFENGNLMGIAMGPVGTSNSDWEFDMFGSSFSFFNAYEGSFVDGFYDLPPAQESSVPEPGSLALLGLGLLGLRRTMRRSR